MTRQPRTEPQDARDRRIGARNRARVLRAAKQVFARKGFDGTRIAEIAERAGLPKANVYYYFASKEVIYRTIIEELLAGWNKAFDCITAEREPATAITDYVRAKLEYSRRHGAESKIFANEAIGGGKFLSRADRAAIDAMTRQKAQVVEHWIAAGRLRPVDPRHFFMLLWASTQFYAQFDTLACGALGVRRLRRADFTAAAATIAALVLHGCGGAASGDAGPHRRKPRAALPGCAA